MYVNYTTGAEPRLGYLDGDRLFRLDGPSTDRLLVEGFPQVPGDAPVENPRVRFLPAVLRPGKLICLLRSYRKHAEELGNEPPGEPMFFAKLPNALTGHREPIIIPRDLEGEVHHEGELALVLGSGGKRLSVDEAGACVAAYTVANDITARTQQKADAGRGMPWLRAKSRDTFLPLGPGLMPAERVPDPHSLGIRVKVNGETRQESNTSFLMWSLGEVLAHISRYISLDAGDVVLTGTPDGVGPIAPGDRVIVTIDGLGRLENSVEFEA